MRRYCNCIEEWNKVAMTEESSSGSCKEKYKNYSRMH